MAANPSNTGSDKKEHKRVLCICRQTFEVTITERQRVKCPYCGQQMTLELTSPSGLR